jgi:hypothetical protein
MDPISAIVAVALFAAGVLAGRLRRTPQDTAGGHAPVCGCTHHLSMHDPETGHCHGYAWTEYSPPNGAPSYDLKVDCACRRYVGPEPLAVVWAEPIAVDPGTGVALRKIGPPALSAQEDQ